MTIQTIIAENVDFETFLRGFEEKHIEYVDGKVILSPPITAQEHDITGFLRTLLDAYLCLTDEGQVYGSTYTLKMTIEGKLIGRLPDILAVATPHVSKITEWYCDGAADLVVEVITFGCDAVDRIEKILEYQAIGVREYWIIDPYFKETLFYVLREDKRYHRKKWDEHGVYQSEVFPRFRFDRNLLFQQPVPGVVEAVALAKKMIEE